MKKAIKNHPTAEAAYNETTKKDITAVVVVTYIGENETREYFTFKTKKEYNNAEQLAEDFPMCLGSNQYIREIDQFD